MLPQPNKKIFVDHKNLINIFATDENLKEYNKGKLIRRASKIAPKRYTIEHLDGEWNLWADILSRGDTLLYDSWLTRKYTVS